MDKKIFIERLVETENLTDELDDQDAKWLLDWGVRHLDDTLLGVTDEDTATHRITALMAIMRHTNHLVGNRRNAGPEILESEQKTLGQLFSEAFGQKEIFLHVDLSHSVNLFRQMTARDALEFVLGNKPSTPGKPYDRQATQL
jgi:hypothetical protein